MNKIKVFAPATVANVACGFDIFGLAVDAPGDVVHVTERKDEQIIISKITGDNGKLTKDPNSNTVTVPILKFLEKLGIKKGFDIELHKQMPLGSGLGSSSASAVAGVYGVNKLLGSPLKDSEILPFAMEGERVACGSAHADNVAPALLGGFVLIRSYEPLDVIKILPPENLWVTIVHPDVEVNTKDARFILRQEVAFDKTIAQMGNVAGFIAGMMNSDYELIGRSMTDYLIEPKRSILIPGFNDVKQAAIEAGALGCSISGAGPSIFALSNGEVNARNVGNKMNAEFSKLAISSNIYVSKINREGPKIL